MTPSELKKARLSLGLSQEKLAIELGVHRKTLITWEAGKVKLPRMLELALRQLMHEYFRKRVDSRRPNVTAASGAGAEMKSKPARVIFVVRGEMSEEGLEFSWASLALVLPQFRVQQHESNSVTESGMSVGTKISDSKKNRQILEDN